MSSKKVPETMYPQVPSAPDFSDNGMPGNRNPPPSYEESLKNAYPPHPPPVYPQGSQYGSYSPFVNNIPNPSAPGGSYMAYYNNAPPAYPMHNSSPMHSYQQPVHQTQQHVVYSSLQHHVNGPQTLMFDSGARFKGKGAGNVTVPPPPPGYLPTPAQLAALQGQHVMLKKKKNSFF